MSEEDISTEITNEPNSVGGGSKTPTGPPKLVRRRSTNMKFNESDRITIDKRELFSSTLPQSPEQVILHQPAEPNRTESEESDDLNSVDQSDDNYSCTSEEPEKEKIVAEYENDGIGSTDANDTNTQLYAPEKPVSTNLNLKNASHILLPILMTIVVVLVGVGVSYNNASSASTIDIQKIKAEFPQQDDELWISFESGVNDVGTLNRPSTFILLYENKSENTVKNLISQLSKFAICNITTCDNIPITLTESELNSPEIIQDYGELIDRYRNDLEERGVMVIKNLEKIRGVSAQAFHTFCDEFTPLVKHSLFIFTMKVDELPGKNKMKFVEDDLKRRWSEVKTDTLVALITRITSMVIEIL